MGNEKPPFQGGGKTRPSLVLKKIFERGIHAVAFCKSAVMKLTEPPRSRYIERRATNTINEFQVKAPFDSLSDLPSPSRRLPIFFSLSLSPYCQNLSNEGKSCTSVKRSSIIDPPLAYSIYAKRELFIRAHEAEWNGSRSKLLDWTLAS